MKNIIVINEELCTGCGACVEICPRNILFVDEKDDVCRVTDETQCDRRRGCEQVCPSAALKIN
jgi:NAD-dependent dihydropyrimidine dehydrogenase PreA subunit